MEGKTGPKKGHSEDVAGAGLRTGAIALAFLILGFQLSLFVHRAAVTRIVANRDRPDTVYIEVPAAPRDCADGPAQETPASVPEVRRAPAPHSRQARAVYEQAPARRVESFRFDPNTAGPEDLQRLGFTEKQALSILNYREKGGRFRRKSDFAKSYVVSDSVFRRLEPFIDIPLLDINSADSAAFDALPGIGGWFAQRMVEYREQLRGYSCTAQLMEIYRFDRERYDALSDLICCSPAPPYPFWSGSLEDIRSHPHIRRYDTARAIVIYRDNNPREKWTPEGLGAAGIITPEQVERLARCRLE